MCGLKMNHKILFLIFAVAFISLASAIENPRIYYKLNLDYSYGNIFINSTEIELSDKEIENPFGFYSASILDSEGNLLNLTLFDVPNEILYDSVNEEGEISGGGFLELNQTNFEIFVPYYSNAKEIVIYDENLTELTRKDISEFSKEKQSIVSEEVPEKENEKKTGEKPTEILTEKIQRYWWVLVIVLAVLVVYLFYSVNRKK